MPGNERDNGPLDEANTGRPGVEDHRQPPIGVNVGHTRDADVDYCNEAFVRLLGWPVEIVRNRNKVFEHL